jgi:hypothetical protein
MSVLIDCQLFRFFSAIEAGLKVECTLFTDSLNLVTLLSLPHPRPGEASLLPELLLIQRKLAGSVEAMSDRDVRTVVVPLMAARDLLGDCSLAAGNPVSLSFIPGTQNPADVLTKPREVTALTRMAA